MRNGEALRAEAGYMFLFSHFHKVDTTKKGWRVWVLVENKKGIVGKLLRIGRRRKWAKQMEGEAPGSNRCTIIGFEME